MIDQSIPKSEKKLKDIRKRLNQLFFLPKLTDSNSDSKTSSMCTCTKACVKMPSVVSEF